MNKTILQNHDSSNILLHRCHEGNETFKTVLDGNAKFYSQVVQFKHTLGYTAVKTEQSGLVDLKHK